MSILSSERLFLFLSISRNKLLTRPWDGKKGPKMFLIENNCNKNELTLEGRHLVLQKHDIRGQTHALRPLEENNKELMEAGIKISYPSPYTKGS